MATDATTTWRDRLRTGCLQQSFAHNHEPWWLTLTPHLEDHSLQHGGHGCLKLPIGKNSQKFSWENFRYTNFLTYSNDYKSSTSCRSEKGDNNSSNVNPGQTIHPLAERSRWSRMTKGMQSYCVRLSGTERIMMCRILRVVLGPYQTIGGSESFGTKSLYCSQASQSSAYNIDMIDRLHWMLKLADHSLNSGEVPVTIWLTRLWYWLPLNPGLIQLNASLWLKRTDNQKVEIHREILMW